MPWQQLTQLVVAWGFQGTWAKGPCSWPGVCEAPLLHLNEVMTPQETGFKDTSVVSGGTCVVHTFIFPLHTGSLCTCWQELVIWNSLQGWAVKSLVGIGYSYGGKGRTRRNKREHLPSQAYWAVRFQSLSGGIDFLSYIRPYVLLHLSLTRALQIMGLLWWLWPHQEARPHIDLCWRQAKSFIQIDP